MTNRTIWVTRHGMRQDFIDPVWRDNATRPHDTPLSREGFQQASETGQRLRGENITAIYASPFLRTVQTAGVIASILELPLHIEHGICEALKPEWFGTAPDFLPVEHLQPEYPHIVTDYRPVLRPRYPEFTNETTYARCHRAVQAIIDATAGDLLFVGHGASVQGILAGLTARAENFDCSMCALNKITWTAERWELTYSSAEHLTWREETVRFN